MLDNISVERKKEIYDIALNMRDEILELYCDKIFDPEELLTCSLYYYKKQNKDYLRDQEQAYFLLHILIPDDLEFLNNCKKHKSKVNPLKISSSIERYDFNKIAKLYGISPKFAQQRYRIMLDNFRNGIVKNEDANKNFEK